jgi:hypothetical protein
MGNMVLAQTELICGELVSLVSQHYGKFDSRNKGLITLRRIYVPEAIETLEEE